MSFSIEGSKVDKQFIGVIHRAAQEIGSIKGHEYLVISGETLKSSPKKSEEASFEDLTNFVNKRLKDLTKLEEKQVRSDLSKIVAEHHRQDNSSFKMTYDIFAKMTEVLGTKDFASIPAVSHTWNNAIDAEDQHIRKTQVEAIAFGAEKWKKHFAVDVGEVPPIPANMYATLNSPCLFFPGKKVGETQLLILIPATVDGQPLTLKSLRELIKHPQQENRKTDYSYIPDECLAKHGDTHVEAAHWVLMTKDVIPESLGKSFAVQRDLARAIPGYDIPNVLPAAVSILANHVNTGKRLYASVYTRCLETLHENDQVVVGDFAPAGLCIRVNYGYDYRALGVAALRKL